MWHRPPGAWTSQLRPCLRPSPWGGGGKSSRGYPAIPALAEITRPWAFTTWISSGPTARGESRPSWVTDVTRPPSLASMIRVSVVSSRRSRTNTNASAMHATSPDSRVAQAVIRVRMDGDRGVGRRAHQWAGVLEAVGSRACTAQAFPAAGKPDPGPRPIARSER
jgi:hypothetical protein